MKRLAARCFSQGHGQSLDSRGSAPSTGRPGFGHLLFRWRLLDAAEPSALTLGMKSALSSVGSLWTRSSRAAGQVTGDIPIAERLARLPAAVGVPSGRSSTMFKRAKGLPHVVQFTQRGVELLRAQGDLRLLHTGAFASILDVQDEQQDDDDGE